MEKEVLKRFKHIKTTGTDEDCALELLSQLSDPASEKDGEGYTLLHYACNNGWCVVVKTLVEKYLKAQKRCDIEAKTSTGATPLHIACLNGKVDIAKYLIEEQGCSVTARDKDGFTLLHYACQRESVDMVKYLTAQKGCNTEAENSAGATPLHIACLNGKMDIAKYLIEEQGCSVTARDKDGRTLLQYACQSKNVDMVKYLTAQKGCDIEAKTSTGSTPLHTACLNGMVDIAKYLIEEQGCSVTARGTNGRTPLHYACRSKNVDMVKYLTAQKGCDIEAKTSTGSTPLHTACLNGMVDIAKYLIKEQGCSVTARDKNGCTPLHYACQSESVDIVKYLTSQKGCDTEATTYTGTTPLHIVCQNGKVDIAKYLIEEQGCSVTARDKDGRTLLHYACQSKNVDMVKYLTAQKGCNIEAKTSTGATLLHSACLNGKVDIAKYLIKEQGCSVTARDENGCTPLHYVCQSESVDMVKYLTAQKGCDTEAENNAGATPLHITCLNGKMDIAKYLIEEKGCSVTARDKDGFTLLHYACQSKNVDIVKYLTAQKGCDNEAKTSTGATLLHSACLNGMVDIAKYLIEEQGCGVTARDKDGDTPFHYACQRESVDMVKYLTAQKGCDADATNLDGVTPLEYACHANKLDVVKHLVNEKNCNVFRKSKSGSGPLYWASKETLEFLLSSGTIDNASTTPFSVPLLEAYREVRQGHPLYATSIVFVMGNSSAGKSTLVKAIQNRLTDTRLLGSLVDSFRKVSGVELHTAGIKPVHVQSRKCGSVILYDFAGQYEYYSSHAATLQSLLSTPECMVLLVVDLSQKKEEVIRTLRYWGSFIANHCSGAGSKTEVAVIGSHADVVKKQGEKGQSQLSECVDCLQESLQIKASIAIDCTQLASGELNKICDVIGEKSVKVRQQFHVNVETHFVFHLLLENCGDGVYTLSEVASKIPMNWKWTTKHSRCNATLTDLISELKTLNNKGQILFLENTTEVEKSWVITNKKLLLAEVSGTVFAPENFVQHHDISNSTGVVPLSNIRNVFPQYDPEMIISFLCHLQYCQEISKSEAALVGQHDTSQSESSERLYFFPALVQENRPTESCKTVAKRHYRCGWVLQCRRAHQFLSPRFLHVLLLQLAFTFALRQERKEKDGENPVLQRKCNVWKSGIHWVDRDGVEMVVEVVEQNTAVVVVMGCLEGCELACAKLRSRLIRLILDTQAEHSPAVVTSESFIDPSELTTYPLKKVHKLTSFSVSELAIVLAEGGKELIHKLGTMFIRITPSKLLTFEPMACLSPSVLQSMFCDKRSTTEVNSVSYSDIGMNCHPQMHLLESVLGVQSQVPSSFPVQPPTEKSVLERWKSKVSSATYGDLRAALEQFSVFRGKNLLEVSDLSENHLPHSLSNRSSSTGSQPTLPELISLQLKGKTVNIAEKISTDYFQFGIQILGDEDGSRTRAIEHRHLRDAVRINTDILEEWLQGSGIQPVSWTTLVEVLKTVDLAVLASDIREAKGFSH